ncbi:MAG: NTP transferase domain-containing protein [Thermoplasmatota archaeon]
MRVSAIVLAGGRTRRMGKPRALLQLKERPLVWWTVRAMSGVAAEVIVTTAHGWVDPIKRLLPQSVRVVEDVFVGLGPLGGLHAGAGAARHRWLAVAPSEAALVRPKLYSLLMREAGGLDGAVPELSGRRMHLYAVYRRSSLASRIDRAISRGESDVGRTLRGMRLARVGARKLDSVDPDRSGFLVLSSLELIRAVESGSPGSLLPAANSP